MTYWEVYGLLDEKCDYETQKKGVEFALEAKEIDKFILPMYPNYNKNIWSNCAKVIKEKTDQELTPYLIKLLEWLQDLNWPGTFTIIERLKKFEGKLLLEPYIKVLNIAIDAGEDGREWADHLSVLIENQELACIIPQKLYKKIEVLYNEFWT